MAQNEEERLLQAAMEESKHEHFVDPNNPDVDSMSYEQLMELQENAGQVNRGYSEEEINTIRGKIWHTGATKESECLICMEEFKAGLRYKRLNCGHEYDSQCID